MKNDLPYFSHDNNASQHPKMRALIAEYGYAGYGMFWALNEKIARNDHACIDISRKVYKNDLAYELRLTVEELDNFIKFLSDPEIDLINFEKGIITTDRITEQHKFIISKRKKQRKNENDEINGENDKIVSENGEINGDFDTKDNKGYKNIKKENITNSPKQTEAEKLFLHYWQHNPDIFNTVAGFDSYESWRKFWDTSPPTPEYVETAMKNFIADIQEGFIERRFIPSKPDKFIKGNWLNTCQKRRKPQNQNKPPTKIHKITADNVPEGTKLWKEAT